MCKFTAFRAKYTSQREVMRRALEFELVDVLAFKHVLNTLIAHNSVMS